MSTSKPLKTERMYCVPFVRNCGSHRTVVSLLIYYNLDATTALGAGGILARLDEIQNSQAATRAIVDENRAMLQETRAMVMNIRLSAQNAKVPQERDHYKPLQKTVSVPVFLFLNPEVLISCSRGVGTVAN
jgi:hypothetical protein